MNKTVHYIYDPLCGWCYAAERLVETLAHAGLDIQLHAGGLFNRTQLPAATREHIRHSDARIAQLSGQEFGDAYLNGLLMDDATVYDSAPTIAAILAAQTLQANSGLAMLKAIQHAHYRDGRRVVEPQTLADLAESIALPRAAFAQTYQECAGKPLQQHITATRQLMSRVGAQGFPSFVLQQGQQLQAIRHEAHYAQPDDFAAQILYCGPDLGHF